MENETRVCECCERELPIGEFQATRWGGYTKNCQACITAKKRESVAKMRRRNAPRPVVTYPEFEGKTPREILADIGNAMSYLETLGYHFNRSFYHEKVTRHNGKI